MKGRFHRPSLPARLAPVMSPTIQRSGVLILALCLTACASYRPRPLPGSTDLATGLADLKLDAAAFPAGQSPPHAFDVSDGLDLSEVAMLAVANNPGLRAYRTRTGVASAQVYAAGLLPDPSLSLGLAHPSTGGPEKVESIDLGLGYDLSALITRQAGRDAEQAARRQIDLDLLWREWQVASQARLLAARLACLRDRKTLLEQAQTQYTSRFRRDRDLLRQGDLTLASVGATASAWFRTNGRLGRVRLSINRVRHRLHALLGLMPDVTLPLAAIGAPPTMTAALDARSWSMLKRRRPDLLALEAGYQSQEQRLRKAVMAQFPGIEIGFSRARDTDGIYSTGLGVTLRLPVFSGNRGQIAIERATRKRLHAEYQARLDRTRSDLSRLLHRQRILSRQWRDLQRRLPELESLVTKARTAFDEGQMTALDLMNLESAWQDERIEDIDLKQALWEVEIALDTLLARQGGRSPDASPTTIRGGPGNGHRSHS